MNTTRVKKSIVCREVKQYTLNETIINTYVPQPGDVALFEVLEIGKHTTIQSDSKRNVYLVEGDHIIASFGNRYATGQFEGYVPSVPTMINDILAIGGVVGLVKSKNADLEYIEPTKVRLIGYACDATGNVINTRYLNRPKVSFNGSVPNNAQIILSVGSSMDSGKTTTAAYICRGLKSTGKKVAYMKLTGTVYTKDQDLAFDLGADATIDFADAGFPSTYLCSHDEILDVYQTLLSLLDPSKPDYIVIEIADGLVQRETDFLLKSPEFMSTVQSLVFSCGDSLGAFYGVAYLQDLGWPPVALAGRFTMSPLLIREVQEKISIPVLTIDQLMTGEFVDLFTSRKVAVSK